MRRHIKKIVLLAVLIVFAAIYLFCPGTIHKLFELEGETIVGCRGSGTTVEPLLYETLDTDPAPVLSPGEALDAFRLAPGFEIELVAAEPLVGEPVAMAWDEYGRLYVVEMRGYMRDAYGRDSDAPVGRVVRLSDIDADGRMDRSEVFLDGLVNPRAVAVVNEGVLIGEPPNLWLCELPRRDALCANRVRVGDYGEKVNAVAVDTAGADTADVDTSDVDTSDADPSNAETADVDSADAQVANVEHLENGLYPGWTTGCTTPSRIVNCAWWMGNCRCAAACSAANGVLARTITGAGSTITTRPGCRPICSRPRIWWPRACQVVSKVWA
ncbi:MAG: hypothetical protein U5K56_15745 [Halioglobus sp.]|nr:hypothetical protein [Halioglobus sp.]